MCKQARLKNLESEIMKNAGGVFYEILNKISSLIAN